MARGEFNRQRGKLEEALEDIDAVLEKEPEEAGAYLVKGQILREQKKLEEAIASLDKATELAPSAPTPYRQRGEIYREQGETAKAIEQFNRTLQLQPGDLLALVHRAEAYLTSERFDEALVDIEAVLKDNPGLTVAHGLRAQALDRLDRLDEEIDKMKTLADAAPEQPEIRIPLALYYLYDKQTEEAISEYGKLLEQMDGKEGEQYDRLRFHALRGRADARLNIGEHAEAVKDFEQALELDDKDTGLLNNFAWVLATSPDDDVRDGKRAVDLATKAVELTNEKEAHILSTLAAAYAEVGDFEAAQNWSQKSVDMNDPEHADQLAKELASYKEKKPWRERQTGEESEESDPPQEEKKTAEPADESDDAPATAETPAKPVSL
jgi:tetratricopeptide (TPR) repeat protein